jgi:hypothetical protein
MKLYLDTEFNGFGGELISMAVVPRDEEVWYEAMDVAGPTEWVAKHVIPVIRRQTIGPDAFRASFHRYIKRFKNPEVICDWWEDAAHFCRMLGGKEFGSSLDFPCRISIISTPLGHPVSVLPHNALCDALALREWHTRMELAA